MSNSQDRQCRSKRRKFIGRDCQMFCHNCGYQIQGEAAFCPKCGTKLPPLAPTPPPEPVPVPVPEPVPAPASETIPVPEAVPAPASGTVPVPEAAPAPVSGTIPVLGTTPAPVSGTIPVPGTVSAPPPVSPPSSDCRRRLCRFELERQDRLHRHREGPPALPLSGDLPRLRRGAGRLPHLPCMDRPGGGGHPLCGHHR